MTIIAFIYCVTRSFKASFEKNCYVNCVHIRIFLVQLIDIFSQGVFKHEHTYNYFLFS